MQPESLRGREVLLVGGSGGIGSAVTDLLLVEAARVIVTYCGNEVRASKWQESASLVRGDVSNPSDRHRMLEAAPALYGVVVFAGDPARVSGPSQIESAMNRSHAVNYAGPILLAREAADRMKSAGTQGSVILISTMQANALFPGSTVYAAEKAALQHAARILAKESRGANIRVNVVSPGVTAAGMAEASIAAGKYDRYIQEGVIGRFGRAIDIARAVRFFLEPDNYITGQVLCVDGGMTL